MRKALHTLALILSLAASSGLSVNEVAADHWLGAEGSGCKVWSDQPLNAGEVLRWSGGCVNHKLQRRGVLDLVAGAKELRRFEGSMRAAMADAEATMEGHEAQGA